MSNVVTDSVNAPAKRFYGWKRGLPDHRHNRYADFHHVKTNNPEMVDLRSLFPPVYDQGSLGSCHDPDTEVLTSDGWKKFKDVEVNDKLATVNPQNSVLTYEKPIRLISFNYSGDMYYGNHKFLDFAVTADHNMLVKKWSEPDRKLNDEFELTPMKDVGWYTGLMGSVLQKGVENRKNTYRMPGIKSKIKKYEKDLTVDMGVWLKFLGIYLAEGTMIRNQAKMIDANQGNIAILSKIKTVNRIQLAASKIREKTFIREVLDSLGITYQEKKDRFNFSDKRIYKELEKYGLLAVKAPYKFVPNFVFKQSAENIKSFLDGHFNGDGSEQNGIRSHYTSSKCLANDLQRLIFLSGNQSFISRREIRESTMKDGRQVKGIHPEYRVSVHKSDNLSIDRKANITIKHYDGMVYCAEVPTYHTLVTRRNGKILVSGNCTANAGAGITEFLMMKQGIKAYIPSRLFIYYNERLLDGSDITQDTGSSLSTCVKVLKTTGAPPEADWWYNTNGDKFAIKPNQKVYAAGKKLLATDAFSIDNTNLDTVRTCLANKSPIVFGFTVYDSFESDAVAKSGVVPMPGKHESQVGGHACVLLGYRDADKMFIVRNSWGDSWSPSMKGNFLIPYAYLTSRDLADDFWTIKKLIVT